MATDFKIVNATKLNSELLNIANSIRTKSGTTGTLDFYNQEFRATVDSIQTPADGSIPTVIHTEPTIVGTFNTTTGNVEMKAGHHADAGYMGLSGTLYNTANVQIGIGTITASGSKTQSTPTFTFNASNGVVTANVAATTGTVTPSVSTAGYVSGTIGTKTGGSFTMGTSQATYNVGLASINTPSGSAVQSKPGMTFDAANGIVTASVAATSGTVYANITSAGYTAAGTKSGTFTMDGSSNTYSVGVATKSTSSVTNSANSVTGWVNVTAGYTPGFNQKVTGNVPASTFDNANKISGTSFLETTGDYGFRASVDLPAGYYAGGTYTKEFKTGIFPAPESKGTADKMLTGYSLYDQDGKLITGTMPNQGAQSSTLTYATNSYTIPAGYHTGAGIINVSKATRATPSVNSVTFNASNNIISIDANVVQTAGVVNAGTTSTTSTKNVYDLVGTGASTISGTIYTGKPGLSVANSTGIVTAAVASAATSLTPSVTAGYITSGTAGSVTAKSNSNTLQLNTKAGGTTTITSNTKIINAGQFATGDIYATVTAGAISAADSLITGGSFTPTLTYNSSSGKFDYGGSKSASGTAYANVSTAGYVTSAKNTSKELSATVSATGNIAKIGTGVDITGTTTKAPTLARTAKPSGDTWTDAASGDATTTKPTSGVYVQIDAAANTGTLTATPKVTSAGYGTTTSGQYSATAGTATVGAAKATTAYVPITTTTPAFDGGSTSSTITPTITKPTVTITESGTFTTTGVSTYGVTTTKPSGTDGTNFLTIDGSGSVTNGKVTGSANITRNAVL